MAQFVDPLSGGLQGVSSGVQMGLQIDQARRARKAQEWDNDFRIISSGLNLAQTKGMSPESQAKILNESVAPAWKKWTGQEFPKMAADNVEAFKPLIKNLNDLGSQAAAGKADWGVVFSEANSQIANYHAETRRAGEVSEKEKAALDAAMAPIKGGFDAAGKERERASKDAKGPDEVLKEMFDLNAKVAGMQQLDQQTANLLAIAPGAASQLIGSRLSPEQLGNIKGLAAARMRALNQTLPADRKLQEISGEEYSKLVKAGVSPAEISRRAYVVPGL